MIEANPRASRTVPVREQGDRRAAREGRVTRDGRRDAGRAARRRSAATARGRWSHRGEGSGAARSTASPTSTPCSGPRCASTGEVMGIDRIVRAWRSPRARPRRGNRLPRVGHGVLLARRPRQAVGVVAARRFAELGFGDRGHRRHRRRARRRGPDRGGGDRASLDRRRRRSDGVDAVELLNSGKVDLVVNTPRGRGAARRRRPHPPHRHRPGHPLRHHRGRRPRRLGRDRGVDRRSPTSAPSRSTTRDGQLRLEV